MHNPEDRSFIGHPRGLAYIAFTEAWERFSYYGMQTLLVLYMVQLLLHPGHVEHIAGFSAFRRAVEHFRGPLAIQPLASTIFGLYTGLVYLTPIAGVMIAPFITGTLGQKVGWHWGFGAAGVGMLFGMTIYLLGRKHLPPDSPVVETKHAGVEPTAKPKLAKRDKVAIAVLIALLP